MGRVTRPIGRTILSTKATKGLLYSVKSSRVSPNPSYRSGYIIFATSLNYHNPFCIKTLNPQCNYQCIFMGLNSIHKVLSRKANALVFLTSFLRCRALQLWVKSRVHSQYPWWISHTLHLFPNRMYYPYEPLSWCRSFWSGCLFQILRSRIFPY